MAWKGRQKNEPDYKVLQTTLVNSKIQTENNPLYQTVKGLIDAAGNFKQSLANTIKKTDQIDLVNQVTGSLLPNNGGVATGSYFPPITDISNINTRSVYYTWFFVTNRLVYVNGKLNIKATAAATLTEIELDLPVPSKFESADQLQGVINGIPLDGATEGWAGIIIGNVSNGQAHISYYPQNTDNHDCRFIMSYVIV